MLDLEGVNFVDSQGSAKLTEIHGFLAADDVGFRRAGQAPGLAVLEADGVADLIGADHIHGNVHRAVEAELAIDTTMPDRQGVPMTDRASAGSDR